MITKRGDSWRVRVYTGLDFYTHKETYRNGTASSEREAKKMEALYIVEASRSTNASIQSRTFPSYADEWLSQKRETIMPNTYRPYVQYIKTAKERFKHFRMGDIQKHMLAKYFDDLKKGLIGPDRKSVV